VVTLYSRYPMAYFQTFTPPKAISLYPLHPNPVRATHQTGIVESYLRSIGISSPWPPLRPPPSRISTRILHTTTPSPSTQLNPNPSSYHPPFPPNHSAPLPPHHLPFAMPTLQCPPNHLTSHPLSPLHPRTLPLKDPPYLSHSL